MRIGVLAGWPIYGMDGPDMYLLDAFRGIAAAAAARGCNVLFAAGLATAARTQPHTALPYIGPNCHYVPVGTFNTDGLILIPPFFAGLTVAQVEALAPSGTPFVFLGQPGPGPSVISDTEAGLAGAVAHLKSLGHTDIAFVAGHQIAPVNYSTHRLAFDDAMRRNHLRSDATRVAYGLHSWPGGYAAMQALLAHATQGSGCFSAVVVDGDESLLGVMDALRDAHLRVPQDVAVVAYNNSLQSQTLSPPVTVVQQQTDQIAQKAAHLLMDLMMGVLVEQNTSIVIRVPERLIVRASCGAQLARQIKAVTRSRSKRSASASDVAREMADAIHLESSGLCEGDLLELCEGIAAEWRAYIQGDDNGLPAAWLDALHTALHRCDVVNDEPMAWHPALAWLLMTPAKAPAKGNEKRIADAIHQGHLAVAQHSQQQQARRTQSRLRTTERMAGLSARLLAAKTDAEILDVTSLGLQQLGTRLACIALLGQAGSDSVSRPENDDTHAHAHVRYAMWTRNDAGVTTTWLEAAAFPPELAGCQDGCTALLVIPFDIDGAQAGFVAMGPECIELGGAIVHQIASAIRSSRLYDQLATARADAGRAKRINPSTRALAQRAMAYIHAHYAGETTRDHIAAHVGIHSDYLTYIFRRETGLTPIAYLNRFRIEQACRMIESGKNITEVALAVGFTDLSYFSRVFRRQLGISPQRFRQSRRATEHSD